MESTRLAKLHYVLWITIRFRQRWKLTTMSWINIPRTSERLQAPETVGKLIRRFQHRTFPAGQRWNQHLDGQEERWFTQSTDRIQFCKSEQRHTLDKLVPWRKARCFRLSIQFSLRFEDNGGTMKKQALTKFPCEFHQNGFWFGEKQVISFWRSRWRYCCCVAKPTLKNLIKKGKISDLATKFQRMSDQH